MNKTALIGGSIVAAIGLVVIVAQSSVTRHGVRMGVKTAEACDKEDHTQCLPHVDFIDVEGNFFTQESLADQVVMVNFWATWCRPCLQEVPALASVYSRYKDKGFVLLGVMTNEVSPLQLSRFKAMTGLNYPVIPLDQDVWDAFEGPPALPMTFIYDRSGSLRSQHRGALSEAKLERIVRELVER